MVLYWCLFNEYEKHELKEKIIYVRHLIKSQRVSHKVPRNGLRKHNHPQCVFPPGVDPVEIPLTFSRGGLVSSRLSVESFSYVVPSLSAGKKTNHSPPGPT